MRQNYFHPVKNSNKRLFILYFYVKNDSQSLTKRQFSKISTKKIKYKVEFSIYLATKIHRGVTISESLILNPCQRYSRIFL